MTSTTHIPQRTCVGCRTVDAQGALLRISRDGPRYRVNGRRRAPGRGVYVHRKCFDRALERGGIARGFKTRVSREAADGLRRQMSELIQSAEGAHNK